MLFIDESIIKLLTEIPTHYSHYYHNYYYYFYQIIINYKVFKVFLSNIFQEASQSLGLLDVCVGGGGEGKSLSEKWGYKRGQPMREVGGGLVKTHWEPKWKSLFNIWVLAHIY